MQNNRVFLNQHDIIEIRVVGPQNSDSVEAMGRQIDALITEQKKLGKPCLVLDDLLAMGAVDADARKLVVELAGRLDYDRLAMLGKGGIMRFGTNLMLRATGRSYKMHYFDNREQAVVWLQEKGFR